MILACKIILTGKKVNFITYISFLHICIIYTQGVPIIDSPKNVDFRKKVE